MAPSRFCDADSQPIWGVVDVAVSKRLSTAAKVVLIVLTLVLLGPVLTFFYAIFATGSGALRKTTVVGTVVFALSIAGVFGLAALAPPDDVTVTTGQPGSVVADGALAGVADERE